MSNPWFKFYGPEYLSDPKVLSLTACERSCWITLLSYACVINDNGMIRFLDEQKLMIQAGVDFQHEEWEQTKGVLKKLETLQMIQIDNDVITIKNWAKRQESSQTGYERLKKFRDKKRNDNAVITPLITVDKIRIDKKRIDNSVSVGRFAPPTLEEVKAYCDERKKNVDPVRWLNFYEAKGWMIGKNKMKDWKAAVRTWEKELQPPPDDEVKKKEARWKEHEQEYFKEHGFYPSR